METLLLSTAYLPPVPYFSALLKHDTVLMEKHENFIKQSYRNRCEILSANGKLILSIPLVKNAVKELITEKKISYAENWQIKHWRAITSAYKNSPYFEYFEEEFKPFYFEKHEFLFEYNLGLIKTILKILRIKKEIIFTAEFQKDFPGNDLRSFTTRSTVSNPKSGTRNKEYYQVFSGKFGFTPDLSIIDLLFNKGLETKDHLSL
jgi:hypothetical protein